MMGREWTYRLRDTNDPEERLEDAALFKALYDASDGMVKPATGNSEADFGVRGNRFRHSFSLAYWNDRAFLRHCGRRFETTLFDGLQGRVESFHALGHDVYIKSGFDKFFNAVVNQGESVADVVGDMAYSFIDSPVPLMVQELVDFTFEHRFFVIGREVVTWSPAAYTLTPIDYPVPHGVAWRKQADMNSEPWNGLDAMVALARQIAKEMETDSAVIDLGMIGDTPACVEFNPFHAGQVGLFACDVRALATAVLASLMENG
ncbi:ATP-grasp domain-containing protein [Croceicoccus sp. YJ47]|uniref:ATP-grasp domain-containing protein n=1 Tax=Croceicoccus sp. YJ47 TaxID=2798724 RepID=UPI001922B4BD|nr:ATP-grasp domain-containing protein [Croceicoccus sp. YJ47]QQN73969.1 ATP-grasp domain-containing protein [Croceicoccus sp. YJ47]